MIRRFMAAAVAAWLLLSPASAVAAVHTGLSTPEVKQPNKFTCVPTSVKMELGQLGITGPAVYDGTPSSPPTDLYHEGLALKLCHKNVEGSGLDPRAWAWLLYNHTPAGHYYDHYKYSSAYSATRVMGEQLYYQHEVAGALVNAGHHAFVFVGYDASCDIGSPNCLKTQYTISNVYVNDPWAANTNVPGADTNATHCIGEDGKHYTCGLIGLGGNRLITYARWTASYFTKWLHQDCANWDGSWVIVRRKPNGETGTPTGPIAGLALQAKATNDKDLSMAPSDLGVAGAEYQGLQAPPDHPIIASSASPRDLEAALAAVSKTIDNHSNPRFKDAIVGSTVTEVVKVASLDSQQPDYLLAAVGSGGRARAVALFTLDSRGGYDFGELSLVQAEGNRHLLRPASDAKSAVERAGHKASGDATLVWKFTDSTPDPFSPLFRVSVAGGTDFVTQDGAIVGS